MTAEENGLTDRDIRPILDAARQIGLTEGYLVRTLAEVRENTA